MCVCVCVRVCVCVWKHTYLGNTECHTFSQRVIHLHCRNGMPGYVPGANGTETPVCRPGARNGPLLQPLLHMSISILNPSFHLIALHGTSPHDCFPSSFKADGTFEDAQVCSLLVLSSTTPRHHLSRATRVLSLLLLAVLSTPCFVTQGQPHLSS